MPALQSYVCAYDVHRMGKLGKDGDAYDWGVNFLDVGVSLDSESK